MGNCYTRICHNRLSQTNQPAQLDQDTAPANNQAPVFFEQTNPSVNPQLITISTQPPVRRWPAYYAPTDQNSFSHLDALRRDIDQLNQRSTNQRTGGHKNVMLGLTSVYQPNCSEIDCLICLEDYNPHDIVHKLPCQHLYHHRCIAAWFQRNPTCPKCRDQAYIQPKPVESSTQFLDSMTRDILNLDVLDLVDLASLYG